MTNPKYLRNSLLAIRIILGIVFLLSGIGKLINASDARYLVELLATQYYWLIEYSNFIVMTTSIAEVVLAVLLLWGKYLRSALTGVLILLAGFSAVLSYFYLQGMSVESCGCFGAFGFASGIEFTLIRNIVLMLLAVAAFLLIAKSGKQTQNEPARETA